MTEKRYLPEPETLLEIGFVLFLGLILGGLTLLLAGRLIGGTQRGGRRAKGAPSPGSVSPERHQHIATVSPR